LNANNSKNLCPVSGTRKVFSRAGEKIPITIDSNQRLMYYRQMEGEMTQDEINRAEWENPDNWSDSVMAVYFSKKDSRLWVPKKIPWQGKTINFAHPSGIRCLLGLMIGSFLLIIFVSIIIMAIIK
jgi:hypothetical protein